MAISAHADLSLLSPILLLLSSIQIQFLQLVGTRRPYNPNAQPYTLNPEPSSRFKGGTVVAVKSPNNPDAIDQVQGLGFCVWGVECGVWVLWFRVGKLPWG